MDSDKYLEGKSMQRPPLFESDHFIYWKNRFETYVKAKDLDLWHIILNGDFPPVAKNEVTQILEVVPFEQQDDDLKKKLAKNNEAKMVLYNALPKKEYERIFMCKTAKDIWQSLLITHQGNSQVKDNKIDLLVQQYEQFTILEEESIDSGFARFNTIITSLKALDEESKDLSSLALDELIGNLKVNEVVIEKYSEIYKGKKEIVKSIALKAKKESSDDETLTSGSDDEEYAIANKILKAKRDLLEKEISELNEKIKKLERSKEIEIACKSCEELKSENARLKETQVKFVKFDKSANSLKEMLDNQKSSSCKVGLGFDSNKASTSGTKPITFVGSSAEKGTDGSPIKVCLRTCLEPDEWIKDSGCSKHMTGNKSLFSTYKAYDGERVDNLAFNLLSVGQICDKKCQVLFTEEDSEIIKDDKIIGNGIRKNGLYVMKLGNNSQDKLWLATVVDNSTLWHRRLGHANMHLIQSLSSKELVRNLPKLKYDKHFCDACKIGKQAHASHKAKIMVSTQRCLELLHMDLFGSSAIKSYGGNIYTLVVVDDYSRYTWTRFLKNKNEAFEKFEILSRKIQNQLGSSIISIRMDHGREFDNEVQLRAYCDAQGITHNFSAPHTPQSNGVVERNNRTLQEMSRTMLNEQSIPQKFWCNVVDTSTYILNRILVRPILGKTPYEYLEVENLL
ncbi:retrovirus-related pol polyprotein from transposon TNT 1-94 [Tanacetum coccineum]